MLPCGHHPCDYVCVPDSVSPQQCRDLGAEGVHVERFVEEGFSAQKPSLFANLVAGESRQTNEASGHTIVPDHACQLESGEARHVDVGDDEVEVPVVWGRVPGEQQVLQRRGASANVHDPVSVGSQLGSEQLAERIVVLGQQNSRTVVLRIS